MDSSDVPTQQHAGWRALTPNDTIEIVKRETLGTDVATYRGQVVQGFSNGWLEVLATWTYRQVSSHGLDFEPGDRLIEYFSPQEMFNVFLVVSPVGTIRGWYGNVTYPAWIEIDHESKRLVWQDLYLDVILLPDGTLTVADEDELEQSRLEATDPELFVHIQQACGTMQHLATARHYPFHAPDDFSAIIR